MGGSPVLVRAAARSSFELWFVDEAGAQRREPLPSCWQVPFERARPSRSFPSFQGQRNFPGLWWSATTGEHVAYESWVERDVAMLLDFDPQIVAFVAQPFGFAGPTAAGSGSMRRTSSLAGRTAPAWSLTCGPTTWSTRRPPGCSR